MPDLTNRFVPRTTIEAGPVITPPKVELPSVDYRGQLAFANAMYKVSDVLDSVNDNRRYANIQYLKSQATRDHGMLEAELDQFATPEEQVEHYNSRVKQFDDFYRKEVEKTGGNYDRDFLPELTKVRNVYDVRAAVKRIKLTDQIATNLWSEIEENRITSAENADMGPDGDKLVSLEREGIKIGLQEQVRRGKLTEDQARSRLERADRRIVYGRAKALYDGAPKVLLEKIRGGAFDGMMSENEKISWEKMAEERIEQQEFRRRAEKDEAIFNTTMDDMEARGLPIESLYKLSKDTKWMQTNYKDVDATMREKIRRVFYERMNEQKTAKHNADIERENGLYDAIAPMISAGKRADALRFIENSKVDGRIQLKARALVMQSKAEIDWDYVKETQVKLYRDPLNFDLEKEVYSQAERLGVDYITKFRNEKASLTSKDPETKKFAELRSFYTKKLSQMEKDGRLVPSREWYPDWMPGGGEVGWMMNKEDRSRYYLQVHTELLNFLDSPEAKEMTREQLDAHFDTVIAKPHTLRAVNQKIQAQENLVRGKIVRRPIYETKIVNGQNKGKTLIEYDDGTKEIR